MNRKAPFHAFTIVELLVVATIMSLLVALLLPSLSSAREVARRVVCLSNQKQIYIGAASYINDNKEYMPPGSNPGDGYIETRGQVASTLWGDFGSFWRDYLQIAMNPNPNRYFFASPKGPLWCPSGTRLSYTNQAALTNPTVFVSGPYTNLGWQESTDYALMGCAPVFNSAPYWPAKSTQWWQSIIQNGPRLFSMDIACSVTGTMRSLRTPHIGSKGLPEGLNCVSVDGSGGWQGRDATTSGTWQYYGGGSGWSSVMMPKKYEVLYTEWNYTFNWAPGQVFSSRNGVSSASYTLDAVGLRRWP